MPELGPKVAPVPKLGQCQKLGPPYILSFDAYMNCIGSFGHKRTNNVMERYNRDFNNLIDSHNPGLFVFVVQVREVVKRSKNWHDDALEGSFTNSKVRKELLSPGVPQDFDGWEPKKRRGK